MRDDITPAQERAWEHAMDVASDEMLANMGALSEWLAEVCHGMDGVSPDADVIHATPAKLLAIIVAGRYDERASAGMSLADDYLRAHEKQIIARAEQLYPSILEDMSYDE